MCKRNSAYNIILVTCILVLSVDIVFSSGGRPPAPAGNATSKPGARAMTGSNISRQVKSGTDQQAVENLKEGEKIRITGKLISVNGRFALKSEESGKEYLILENSALEKMEKMEYDAPGTVFRVTARVTGYKNGFYIFIVEAGSGD